MSRVAYLDGLRGLAGLAVMLCHFTGQFPDGLLKQAFSYGWLGVEVFFVISGAVMPIACAQDLSHHDSVGRFFVRRMLRLYPPFLAAVLLTLGLNQAASWVPGFAGHPPHVDVMQVLLNVTYLAGVLHGEWLSPVYWTLALEVQWYLLLVVLGPWFLRYPLVLVITALVGGAMWSGDAQQWLPGWLPLFAIGWALGLFATQRLSLLATLSMVSLFVLQMSFGHGADRCAAVVFATLAVLVVPRLIGRLAPLGQPSYSLYLIHVPIGGKIINLAKRLDLSQPTVQWAALGAAVSITWLASRVWVFLFEKPSIKLSRRVSILS